MAARSGSIRGMQSNIRNFVIIAHIDHGKSTLADRLLEVTGTIPMRSMKPQYLDQLELERERGITIKMAPVRMVYHSDRGLTQTNVRTNADPAALIFEDLTYKVRGAIFTVKKNLGLGHKELIYQNALELEFKKLGLAYEREKSIDINYDDQKIGTYRPDFLVDDRIIIELKALPFIGKTEELQLWSYIKSSQYKLGLLVNFGGKDVEIKRIVYDTARIQFPRGSASESPRESAQVEYILNLIDTPGHSDFGYEVSRALMAVEGAILLVDATQGIQAQTLANFEQARKAGLKIIGAVNKIDAATPDQTQTAVKDLAELLAVEELRVARISGKTGVGVPELLEAVIAAVPPPHSPSQFTSYNLQLAVAPRALIFDSSYDEHKGVIAHVRVFDGSFTTLEKEDAPYRLAATSAVFKPKEVGYFSPQLKPSKELNSGEIGYIATGLKDPDQLRIGDTVILKENTEPLHGFKIPHPVVFVSFYPEENDEYENLKTALGKLRLNDSALQFEADTSEVLGRGFKGGFLGQLHFEITAERLAREFNVETVHSFPSVAYRVNTKSGWQEIKNPKDFPTDFITVEQPMAQIEILAPSDYLGAVLQLSQSFRFSNIETRNFGNRVIISAKIPLSDLIRDFDDQLKSSTQGFASLSYELAGYEKADVKKMEILVASHVLPGLTRIIAKEDVEREARKMVARLKDLLPKEQFSQAIQAQSDGRIIARETIPALRKDVTGYLYGGDRTRKMKLWKKQQRGKAKLKEMAETSQIKIPASVFKELLKK